MVGQRTTLVIIVQKQRLPIQPEQTYRYRTPEGRYWGHGLPTGKCVTSPVVLYRIRVGIPATRLRNPTVRYNSSCFTPVYGFTITGLVISIHISVIVPVYLDTTRTPLAEQKCKYQVPVHKNGGILRHSSVYQCLLELIVVLLGMTVPTVR